MVVYIGNYWIKLGSHKFYQTLNLWNFGFFEIIPPPL
jgi:hypothetical protein